MRRQRGELKRQILEVLWDADGSLTPAEVGELLGADLAYTTVVTVLRRLYAEGVVTRESGGRGHIYRPTNSRDEHIALAMAEALAATRDPATALNHFVGDLGDDDRDVLRRLLRRRA